MKTHLNEITLLKTYIKSMRSQALQGSETETTCSHILRKMEELLK